MKILKINRRKFLRWTTATALGAISFPYIVPSSALGKAGNIEPSNRILWAQSESAAWGRII